MILRTHARTRCRLWAICFLLSIGFVFGQMNTGELGGSVQDTSGAVLPGASISAESAGTGQAFASVSNHSGEYLFPQLPSGIYTLKVSAPNFKQVLARLEIHAGDRQRRDFTLQVGDASEIVEVREGLGGLQLDSTEIRNTVGRQQAVGLPLKGRQFLDLAMLTEGVVRPPGGTRGDALQQAGTLVNVLGQRSGHNLYLLDGVTVTDEHFNNLVIAPSVDSIQEVNIQKTSYAPEFGGKSGAVINVISRAGTNTAHGSLFEFARNNVLDAKNYFDAASAPTPPFRQNQFGGSLGGPVARNRTFFFVSYEGQRVRKTLTQTFSVPTPAIRAGDFTGFPAIFDPTSSTTRQPFVNNRIPGQRLDPVAVGLLKIIPLPNLPGIAQNLLATEAQRINTNQYSARLDHQFSRQDTAYVRASLFDARQFDPFGSGVLQESLLPGFGRSLSTHALNGAASWAHVFRPDLFGEARFGFLTVVGGQQSPNAGNDFAARTGLRGVTANPLDAGFPQVSLGGQFSTMGDPASFIFRNNRDLEFFGNLVWHHGKHTVKLGTYAMHYDFRPVNPNGARGIFAFTPRWTSSAPGLADGSAFADFLLGYPTTAQAGLGRAAMDANVNWMHFYAQDSWQLTPNLKVEWGLRAEFNQNMTDANRQLAAVDVNVPGGRVVVASDGAGNLSPAAGQLLPLLPVPYVSSAAAGWNESLLQNTLPRLAPRGGIAWNLPGNLKTVVRAGFGIYPNQAAYSIITNFAQNLPFFATKTVNSAVAPAPAFTTANALTLNTAGTSGGSNLNHDFMVEYNAVWNLNLEHELNSSTVLSVAYIGSRTVHADSATVLNVPNPGPGAIAARRPVPQLSQIPTIRWDGWASYNALTVGVKRKLARGLLYDANWTWSHAIDDASDPGATTYETNLPQDVRNMRAEKATSSFDHRHRLAVSFVYQLPQPRDGTHFLRAVLGGWQTGGTFTTQSGAPFTVNIASDQANIGAGPAQRPNLFGDPNRGPKTPAQWFDTTAFALPSLYSFGNAPRNAVTGPGVMDFDLMVQKEFSVSETARLQFRAETYNVFNRANFNIPNRTAFTANFGRISSALDSRQLQFALKLIF